MKLSFDHVSAHVRQKTILADVSFTVPHGSLTALIGPNGAGKSTLLRCLTGEWHAYGGRILLGDQDARALSLAHRALTLACLPQSLPHPHVSVRELVSFGRTPYVPLSGQLTASDHQAAEEAMAAAGISGFADVMADTLSGGELRKAFLAMTLAQQTPLIALDEPTAHLDAASRLTLLHLLCRLRDECGKTLLVIMHDLPDVLRFADHIAVLNNGQIRFEGNAEECLMQEIPQRFFGVRLSGDREHGYAVNDLA